MLAPQGISHFFGQLAKPHPHVASGRTGEICPPSTAVFLRKVGVDTVWFKYPRIIPIDLSSFRINLERSFLPDTEPSFHCQFLLICHCLCSHSGTASHDLTFVPIRGCTFHPMTGSGRRGHIANTALQAVEPQLGERKGSSSAPWARERIEQAWATAEPLQTLPPWLTRSAHPHGGRACRASRPVIR
jgi:hypothetical protein